MAKKTGNKLTQNLNEKMNCLLQFYSGKNLGQNATLDEIKNELFEGNNIPTKKNK